jgi:hypothetical protein
MLAYPPSDGIEPSDGSGIAWRIALRDDRISIAESNQSPVVLFSDVNNIGRSPGAARIMGTRYL